LNITHPNAQNIAETHTLLLKKVAHFVPKVNLWLSMLLIFCSRSAERTMFTTSVVPMDKKFALKFLQNTTTQLVCYGLFGISVMVYWKLDQWYQCRPAMIPHIQSAQDFQFRDLHRGTTQSNTQTNQSMSHILHAPLNHLLRVVPSHTDQARVEVLSLLWTIKHALMPQDENEAQSTTTKSASQSTVHTTGEQPSKQNDWENFIKKVNSYAKNRQATSRKSRVDAGYGYQKDGFWELFLPSLIFPEFHQSSL